MNTKEILKTYQVLLVDCTGKWVNASLLESIKTANPQCDKYVCLKTDYVTSQESQDITQGKFHLLTAGMVTSIIEPIRDKYPDVEAFCELLEVNSEKLNILNKALFIDHDLSVLDTNDGKRYLLNTLAESLSERGITINWNETNSKTVLEICKIMKEICIG